MTGIAFIGTGFVADYYMTTLANHPELNLAGVWDRDAVALQRFSTFYTVPAYPDMAACLADPAVKIIVNLTSPESHFAVNRAALEAGKHVYCEKPLAMEFDDAQALMALAERKGLTVCAAPANALAPAYGHFSALLAEGRIGVPRLAYAQMEDGPVFRGAWRSWKSRSGAPWPGLHEFEVGCTLEHSGYALSWLVGLFGPVAHLSAFSALTFPDKGPGTAGLAMAPDFSVGCLTFDSGVTARLTSGLAAPRDRSLTVVGDGGTLALGDLWDYRSPVHLASESDGKALRHRVFDRLERQLGRQLPFRLPPGRGIAYRERARKRKVRPVLPSYPSRIDFAGGIAAQAAFLAGGEPPFYSGPVALHLSELVLALSAGRPDYRPQTCFAFTPAWHQEKTD